MTTRKPTTFGFGFTPAESEHHFIVNIHGFPQNASVSISEHFRWEDNEEKQKLDVEIEKDSAMRVILPREKWIAIADEVKAEFNRRLQDNRIKTGKWKTGINIVSRIFGKELVLLAWAIEDADPSLISSAIKNWLGLMPEERWWLYTMTNAATGSALLGRDKGWRKAVRYALTENPVSDVIHSTQRRNFSIFESVEMKEKKGNKKKISDKTQLSLFT